MTICPPLEGLSIQNHILIYPNKIFGLMIEKLPNGDPNYSIDDLMIRRQQVDRHLNLAHHGSSPVVERITDYRYH